MQMSKSIFLQEKTYNMNNNFVRKEKISRLNFKCKRKC